MQAHIHAFQSTTGAPDLTRIPAIMQRGVAASPASYLSIHLFLAPKNHVNGVPMLAPNTQEISKMMAAA